MIPQLLSRPTPDEMDAAEQIKELDRAITELRNDAVARLAALPICDLCLDKDSLRAVLDDVLRDATHEHRRRAIEKLEGEQ